jgi:hypothetical protein
MSVRLAEPKTFLESNRGGGHPIIRRARCRTGGVLGVYEKDSPVAQARERHLSHDSTGQPSLTPIVRISNYFGRSCEFRFSRLNEPFRECVSFRRSRVIFAQLRKYDFLSTFQCCSGTKESLALALLRLRLCLRFDCEELAIAHGHKTCCKARVGFDENNKRCHLLGMRSSVVNDKQAPWPKHSP